MLTLTNAERAKVGARPLIRDPRLDSAAGKHSEFMASHQLMSHTGAGGSSPDQRRVAAGGPYPGAENVAYGQPTAPAVIDAWVHSPEHFENMRDPRLTHMGEGVARGADGLEYWTQEFGQEDGQ